VKTKEQLTYFKNNFDYRSTVDQGSNFKKLFTHKRGQNNSRLFIEL
jgi:hypothetical protein